MRGLEVERVAEILVETATGDRHRGSGYLVAPGRVLTAAHVVASAMSVRVRFEADRPGERMLEAEVRFEHPPTDIAVLAVPLDEVPVARFGRVGERDAVLRCSAMGFPAFKMREGEDGRPYRDAEHVHGTCAVLSNRREGTLDLSVPPPGGSWDGMSGAAVFSGGRIVGVVAAHHLADGAGRLAVSRADRWAERLPDGELSRLEELLSASFARNHLPDVIPPSSLGLIEAGYQALLRDIAPPELMGRAEELRELVDFCAGPETYRWIQGRPWTGKTALVSWFVLHPPRGVVPVSFFITSRLAGQADSTAYTEAVVHQLAAIVGREPSPHASPGVREAERRALLTEAAERVAEDGATLLLVVDGLDEDQSARDGATGPSVASLLPERPPPGIRVLVTSRPNPGLPMDVKGGHPLRRCAVRKLSATDYGQDLEHEARFELSRALAGGDLEKEIVGLLAAARGSLRPEDLRELTGRQLYAVRQRVDGVFGRILRRRGHSSRGPDERGYLFAHETLFAAAVEMLGPDVGPYLERIHDWADEYRRRGWPEATPPYLLQQYGRMAARSAPPTRAVALVSDARWLDRVHEATGSDAAALAQIDAVRQALSLPEAPADLSGLAALAAAQDALVARYGSLPAEVPGVLARLGKSGRAEGLARSVAVPLERARALAGVARAFADIGERRAAALATEAVRLVERHAEDDRSFGHKGDVAREVARTAASALAAAGHVTEAIDLAERVAECDVYSPTLEPHERDLYMSVEVVEILVAVALAARPHDPCGAADVLDSAVARTLLIGPTEWRVLPLAEVARAFAEVDSGRASKLWDMVEECAALEAPDRVVLLAVTAAEMHSQRPAAAQDLARSAYALFGSMGDQQDRLRLPTRVLAVVDALVTCGLMREAEGLADAYHDTAHEAGHGEVAKGYLRMGEAERARQLLRNASRARRTDKDISPFMARELAAGGHFDAAESWAAGIDDPMLTAHTLGAIAEQAVGCDPARATALAAEAIVSAGSKPEALWHGGRLLALSEALMTCGERSAAERLARTISSPDDRSLALAAIAVGLHASDPVGAAHVAEAAADICESLATDLPVVALEATVEALAHTGAGGRVGALVDGAGGGHSEALVLRAAAREQSVVHSPDRADAAERQARGEPSIDDRTAGLAELVVAFARTAPERVDGLLEALRAWEAHDKYLLFPESALLMMVLLSGKDPGLARWLERYVEERLAPVEGGFVPVDATAHMLRALVHAAHAEYEAAESQVSRLRWPEDVARVRTALAATIAGLPTWPPALSGHHRPLRLIQQCIELTVRRPPADAARIARARAQLHQVLAGENWHHALPVLAHLDPDAVRRVRDVVFAHLGLEVSPDPPQPPPAPA
ncbi:trypsin-like peptidase domain-containing protein [Streptomyces sp. RTd22]|uniref:trypsin-like peptidase domain-containing protein n=1 Tax=Streptomyces sp. RTd22 TaxID=1841249 RepID=UPI0007C47A76|nr:trypsin-like peptidase domain-containing protein [Streptomyces sp. RTd22]